MSVKTFVYVTANPNMTCGVVLQPLWRPLNVKIYICFGPGTVNSVLLLVSLLQSSINSKELNLFMCIFIFDMRLHVISVRAHALFTIN